MKRRNKHHLTPKHRGGLSEPNNLLIIDIERHACWHKIFKNLTLGEVISLLQRVKQKKNWNMYKDLFCWKCAKGKQNGSTTSQTVLEESTYPDGSVLIRAVCTICGTGNSSIKKGGKSEGKQKRTS